MPSIPRIPVVVALAALGACSGTPSAREYQLEGQILEIRPATKEVLVKHGDIPGFMPAMTMPYSVKDEALLADKQPGDLITATLVVAKTEAHLSNIAKTGHAPVEDDRASDNTASDILKPGQTVPDTRLIDEDGVARPLSSLKGHRVALTFIYTNCPQPDFCPLMDRNFAAVQGEVMKTPALGDVRLVSVSFDPAHDTPAVLKAHAQSLHANPAVWHFVTTDPADIRAFAATFGVTAVPGEDATSVLVHNLGTAIVAADGTLVKIRPGNAWTPADLIADFAAVAPPAH